MSLVHFSTGHKVKLTPRAEIASTYWFDSRNGKASFCLWKRRVFPIRAKQPRLLFTSHLAKSLIYLLQFSVAARWEDQQWCLFVFSGVVAFLGLNIQY